MVHSARPEEWTISVQVKEDAWVILSQLADPQWKAWWIGEEGQPMIRGKILPAFRKESQPGGWQCLSVPPPGHWTLRLEYDCARRGGGRGHLDGRVALLDPRRNHRGYSSPARPARGRASSDRSGPDVTAKIGVAIVGASDTRRAS